MPEPFNVIERFSIEDTAERPDAPPIQVEAVTHHGWPELHVCGADGRPRRLACLDYHDGRLRVLVYDLTRSEEPKGAITMAEADASSLADFLSAEPVL